MNFPKPKKESDYFKGILRALKTTISSTSSYYSSPNDKSSLLQNDLQYYWHSREDASFNQYVEISIPITSVKITSYMISSGNNGNFYLKSWKLNCSMNGNGWTTIDDHRNESAFTASKQMRLFDVKKLKQCNTFRFIMNGKENLDRNYMYIGPVEFYSDTACNLQSHKHCNSNQIFQFFFIFDSSYFLSSSEKVI